MTTTYVLTSRAKSLLGAKSYYADGRWVTNRGMATIYQSAEDATNAARALQPVVKSYVAVEVR